MCSHVQTLNFIRTHTCGSTCVLICKIFVCRRVIRAFVATAGAPFWRVFLLYCLLSLFLPLQTSVSLLPLYKLVALPLFVSRRHSFSFPGIASSASFLQLLWIWGFISSFNFSTSQQFWLCFAVVIQAFVLRFSGVFPSSPLLQSWFADWIVIVDLEAE